MCTSCSENAQSRITSLHAILADVATRRGKLGTHNMLDTKADIITSVGMQAIRDTVYCHLRKKRDEDGETTVRILPHDFDAAWKRDNECPHGTRGSITKRVRQWYAKQGIKLPKDLVSELGNIANRNMTKEDGVHFKFTRKLNWSAGDFGDSGSCFWSCRSGAREMIHDAGGFAMQFFTSEDFDNGYARSFFVPCQYGFVLFNAYGITTDKQAQLFALHTGLKPKRVSLTNNGISTGVLWINGTAGYLFSPLPHDELPAAIDLDIEEVLGEVCCNCGETIDTEYGSYEYDEHDRYWCTDCFWDEHFCCECCNETYPIVDQYNSHDGVGYCDHCYSEQFYSCDCCDEETERDDVVWLDNGEGVCPDCWEDNYTICEQCSSTTHIDDVIQLDGESGNDCLCSDCFTTYGTQCEECREHIYVTHAESREEDGRLVCQCCS